MSTPPPPPAGWYPDTAAPELLRYWDGAAWTAHTAPMAAPPPAATTQPAAVSGPTRACPYCAATINAAALRCGSCAGELKYCKSCGQNVGMTSKQKFVGLIRGGMKTQFRCMKCDRVLDGPRM